MGMIDALLHSLNQDGGVVAGECIYYLVFVLNNDKTELTKKVKISYINASYSLCY